MHLRESRGSQANRENVPIAGELWARLQMNTSPFCKYDSGASECRSGCQEAFRFLSRADLGLVPATIKMTLEYTGSSSEP